MKGPDRYPFRPWLLVSDIDDTLTGDAVALQTLATALLQNRERLWFAVNSSRPADSVARTLADDFPLGLRPDAVISALGTEIAQDGKPLQEWQDRRADWPQEAVFAALLGLGHRPHADEFQTPLKVSFAVPQDAQQEARSCLARLGLACTIIASGKDDFDVIPPGTGKGTATLFLGQTLGLTARQIVVAGDSGNDLAMFDVAGQAIAVGNARQELLSAMPATSFHATRPHAAGVLEGLIHFGVLTAAAPSASD